MCVPRPRPRLAGGGIIILLLIIIIMSVQARNKGERWALAAMVMGSVADLMKAIVVELHASLRAEFGPCSEVDGPAALEIPRDAPVLLAVCGTEIVLECAASHLPALHKV